MITVNGIYKKFGKLQVLNDVSVSFSPGKITAIIGHNGSGKTTLMKCILGMVLPDAGSIEVDGNSVKGKWLYRNQLGYMPQIGRYPDNMNMGQIFSMMMDIRGENSGALDDALINQYFLKEMFTKKMRTLSGGTRQKVSAALAFLFNPDVLILDEPTAGLDPMASEVLKEKIVKERNGGKTILITSHIMSEVDELADEILFMQDGQVKFHRSLDDMKQQTGEDRIGKALSKILAEA